MQQNLLALQRELSSDDTIEVLNLSIRPLNALTRAGIVTLPDLIETIESGRLPDIYGIGANSIAEIEQKLACIDLSALSKQHYEVSGASSTDETTQDDPKHTFADAAIQWQVGLIKKQLAAGLLHEKARIAGKSISDWLSIANTLDRSRMFQVLASTLSSSINVCEELSCLLNELSTNYISVLLGGCLTNAPPGAT